MVFVGWLTVGPELTNSNFTPDWYNSYFVNGEVTTGCTERIEALRPKSPPPKGKGAPGSRGRGGSTRGSFSRGRGRGLFITMTEGDSDQTGHSFYLENGATDLFKKKKIITKALVNIQSVALEKSGNSGNDKNHGEWDIIG